MASTNQYAVHVKHFSLVIRSVIPDTSLLINIVSPELEDSAIADPLLDRNSMKLAHLIHQTECCRVADTDVNVIESTKNLCE